MALFDRSQLIGHHLYLNSDASRTGSVSQRSLASNASDTQQSLPRVTSPRGQPVHPSLVTSAAQHAESKLPCKRSPSGLPFLMLTSLIAAETNPQDEIKLLRGQLHRAHTDIEQLTAKLTRISRLARLELLPLAAQVPLSQVTNEASETKQATFKEGDIIASEKRLRATLSLILAEIERGAGKEASAKAGSPISSMAHDSTGGAGAALLDTLGEVPKRSRTISDTPVAKQTAIDSIAGRMNLDVPISSATPSSPSPITSSSSAALPSIASSGSDALPARKTLTPEERREMLQQEFLDTEEGYLKSLQKLHDVRPSGMKHVGKD